MRQKRWKIRKDVLLFGLLFIMLGPSLSSAQEYPTRPVKLLVAYAPGGAVDVTTRLIAGKTEKFLGQPFIISNNGGGAGSVALGITSKDRPDGYDLVCATTTTFTLIPQFRAVSYKREDFIPIMHYGAMQTGLVVRADSPWRTLREFVHYAKQNPEKVTYGSVGSGTVTHLSMEYIAKQEGIKWTLVPYPSTAPALTALLGSHITAVASDQTWAPHVKAGTLRLLASHGENRLKNFPEVSTLRELGYDFKGDNMFIIAAPKGVTPAIVKKLGDAFRKGMESPEFIQLMGELGFEITYRDSADTKKYLDEAHARFGKMLVELKIPKEPERK